MGLKIEAGNLTKLQKKLVERTDDVTIAWINSALIEASFTSRALDIFWEQYSNFCNFVGPADHGIVAMIINSLAGSSVNSGGQRAYLVEKDGKFPMRNENRTLVEGGDHDVSNLSIVYHVLNTESAVAAVGD